MHHTLLRHACASDTPPPDGKARISARTHRVGGDKFPRAPFFFFGALRKRTKPRGRRGGCLAVARAQRANGQAAPPPTSRFCAFAKGAPKKKKGRPAEICHPPGGL